MSVLHANTLSTGMALNAEDLGAPQFTLWNKVCEERFIVPQTGVAKHGRACSSQGWRSIAKMLQQAKSALGVAARRLGRSLDGMGAALETHPYTEKCKSTGEVAREGMHCQMCTLCPASR